MRVDTFPRPSDAQRRPERPPLPPGFEEQDAWGFLAPPGRFTFVRVFAPPDPADAEQGVGRLDRDRSYWAASWPIVLESGAEVVACRWISFVEAKALLGAGLSFDRFSSALQMREELPAIVRDL